MNASASSSGRTAPNGPAGPHASRRHHITSRRSLDADEGDVSDAGAAMPSSDKAEKATGTEPGSRNGTAPALEDHAFSDLLRQAARERDVPLAMFTDSGTVAPADRELTYVLVLVERAGGQNIQRAKLAVRQLLAERDRVLREPIAMRLPPITPEKLASVIRSLAATLEQGATAAVQKVTSPH